MAGFAFLLALSRISRLFCVLRVSVSCAGPTFARVWPPGQPPQQHYEPGLTVRIKNSSNLMAVRYCSICKLKFLSLYKRKYCEFCRLDRLREQSKASRAALKLEFLYAYGGRCQCPCGCQQDLPGFLGVGHIENDGKQHREETMGAGHKTYADLKRRGWPKDKYRIECWNCNFGRRVSGTGLCPMESGLKVDFPGIPEIPKAINP